MKNNVECPICEELTGKLIKEVENESVIEYEYICSKCNVVFSKVKSYGKDSSINK